MEIKNTLKRVPGLQHGVSFFKARIEKQKRNLLNKEYRRVIEPLFNIEVLKKRIEDIRAKIQDGSKVTYYIIATENSKLGIYGYINCFLPHIAYAIAKGYVPIIDMKNYGSIYQSADENVWEKFFEQPFGIGLLENAKNRVKRCPTGFYYTGMPRCIPMMEDQEINLWGELFRNLVHYNKRTQNYLNQELCQILKDPFSTIGVIYRPTNYTKGHPIGHPIQPTMKMISNDIERLLCESFQFIYVASDEHSIIKYLEARFPGRVFINKRMFYDTDPAIDFSNYNMDHLGISAVRFDRQDDDYLRGVEYLSSINLVSHCGALVAGGCGGTIAALYLNNLVFRKRIVYQLGRYGFDAIPDADE